MKKNILIVLLSLNSIAPAIAQDNIEDKGVKKPVEIAKGGTKRFFQSDSTMSSRSILFSESHKWDPFSNFNTRLPKYNPLIWNYDLSDTTQLSPYFSWVPFNVLVSYPGLGSYNNAGASILWAPADVFSLESSVFYSRQFGFILNSSQVVYGANLMLKYELLDKLQLSLFGQYIHGETHDPFLIMNDLFPKTKTGVELEYTPKENIKIGAGTQYEQDGKGQKLKPKSIGKLSIGF